MAVRGHRPGDRLHAFIIDVFSRMIVGWQASKSLRADLAIDALEMAVHNCGRTDDLSGLAHHSDRAVQYLAVRYADRLADNAIVASVGSKGGSYDNALAEAFNSRYKRELIYAQGPWTGPGLADVEFATLTYVDWFNTRRLHGEITDTPGYTTPAAHEADYYRSTTAPTARRGSLLTPTAGQVILDGTDITNASPRERAALCRRQIGFVFQSPNLLDALTARENLLVMATLDGHRPAEWDDRATRLLDEMDLANAGQRRPAPGSGGQPPGRGRQVG